MTDGAAASLTARQWLVLVALSLVLFVPGLFAVPPLDRDEARFAQASRQMLESGDWVDIRFQDEARHKKPIGIYWLQAGAVALTGQGPDAGIWAYRLPSQAGAVAAVLLTAWAGTALFGAAAGFAAALVMAGTLLLGVEARLAKTDAVLLAFTLLAQGALARVWLAARDGRAPPRGMALLFWAAEGAAILVKGPIAPLAAIATVLVASAFDRRRADGHGRWYWLRALRPLTGGGLAALIVLPWLVAITIATDGAFFREAVGHDLLGKVAGGQESHGAPPGYYLATFWVTFWPFAPLAGLALPWVIARRREPAVLFCLGWIVPFWLLFEAITTKLPHYTLPVLPAVALLAAAALAAGFAGRKGPVRGLARLWPLILGAVVSLALAAGFVAALWLPAAPGALPWIGLGALAALCAGGLLVAGVWLRRPRLTLAGPLAAMAVTAVAGWQGVVPALEPVWLAPRIAAAVAAHRRCGDSVLAAANFTEPSLVFLTGTATRLGPPEAAAAHLRADPRCGLALVDARDRATFEGALGGVAALPLATIDGFNYARGQRLSLGLYRLAP
ncbi:MAG: glycosyltransferase family 39 protein [Alphaproteobacteria bacterium]